jgi:hypothetical protein
MIELGAKPQFRKWLSCRARMFRWPRLSRNKGSFFQAVTRLEDLIEFFSTRPGSFDGLAESTEYVDGRCYVCQRDTRFTISKLAGDEQINWRETVVCPHCGLSNRLRSCIHIFENQVLPVEDDLMYLTEEITPLYNTLVARHPGLLGSEYSEDAEPGEPFETAWGEVRNEDVTALTFYDRQFHAVLSFDVLEHVPDYRKALQEFHRVLTTGGQLMLSVPFLFGEETRVLARLDGNGEIEHLEEPVYHGDPVSEQGVLCFYEFGLDLLEEMKAAGFNDAFAICYWAPEWGYIMPQVLFVGRKRT